MVIVGLQFGCASRLVGKAGKWIRGFSGRSPDRGAGQQSGLDGQGRPRSLWLLAQARKALSWHCRGCTSARRAHTVDGQITPTKSVENCPVARRQFGARIDADAKLPATDAGRCTSLVGVYRPLPSPRAAASIWPTTGSRQAAVSALREDMWQRQHAAAAYERTETGRKIQEQRSAAFHAQLQSCDLLGMITAPSRRERLTIARTLCARSIFIGVEDFVASAARHDGSQLPGEIGHIFHAAIHALAGKWRHQMRRIAGKENATVSPFIGDARMERVNHAPFDLDGGKIQRTAQAAD